MWECAKPSMADRIWEDQRSLHLEFSRLSACKIFSLWSCCIGQGVVKTHCCSEPVEFQLGLNQSRPDLSNSFCPYQSWEGKGYIAVPACGGSLAEAKRVFNQREGKGRSEHYRHADKNLANPRTSAWFIKSPRRDALLGVAELKLLELNAQVC
eukprot:963941-Pelagomonas_calceolata.AAC.1